ncbi:MAG TPA: hypothetical protein VFL57_04160 [Bryobacteraceae bacterium]|nr:hypothetical protein [Bryobacteraceae bacterium]
MMSRVFVVLCSAAVLVGAASAADKYSGPRPPKPDLPYLLHADNLAPTEPSIAKEETRKDALAYVIPGATSAARTPLSEPIFLVQVEKLAPQALGIYRMEVRNGNREVIIPQKKVKNPPKPIPLKITKLDDRLYRVEVDQPLENGEYTLSPEGSNDAFSFQIY